VTPTVTKKDRLLKAAFEEFSQRGFSGARVDEIASKAGANKALIYQYYGDKEALFKHVLECKMNEMGRISTDDPERLVEVIGEFFDFHAANPWVTRLLLWEGLDFGAEPVPNEAERKKHLAEHVAQLEEFQREGFVDPGLDAKQALATLIGMVQVWFSLPQVARMISGGNPYTPEALRKRRAHLVETAKKILEVR